MTNRVRRSGVWVIVCCLGRLCIVEAQEPVRDLRITVQQGEGNFNNIRRRLAHDIVVTVRDQLGRPAEKAQVTFVLPEFGPSGTFSGGTRIWKCETDERGNASTQGLRPNSQEGRFNIAVKAIHEGMETTAVVSQSNTMAGGIEKKERSRKTLWIIGLAAGGAAAAGFALRGRGNDSSSPTVTPTSLAIGSVTVGAPR